jgi:hypothetical protein
MFKRNATLLAVVALAGWTGLANAAPSTTELQKYLVVATGSGSVDNLFEAFDMNGGELGADQEVVSSGSGWGDVTPETQQHDSYTDIGIDLTGDFVPNDGQTVFNSDNRWTDSDPDYGGDTVGVSDFLPGARPLLEAPDYSGNVAITGDYGYFVSENADYFAELGIQCTDTVTTAQCYTSNDGNNSWKESDAAAFVDLSAGVSQFDPTALLAEMSDWQSFINSLAVEDTIDSNIENINYKDSGAPSVTDLDVIDTKVDGFALIEIDVGDNDWLVNNTDWILKTLDGVIAIFRIKAGNDTNILFANSSIMMGPGCLDSSGDPTTALTCYDDPITELGAIFMLDHAAGNQVFNVSNTILGGVALWDLDANRDTIITLNNVQGCTQIISSKVEFSSKERLNRCAFAASPPTEVPEPSTLALMLIALFGFRVCRRRALRA